MFGLTRQERRVILFLISVVLVNIGLNFAIKVNSRIEKFIQAGDIISKIDINQATCEDLLNIKGISPKLAQNIIAYRDKNGSFRELEDLKEVKGIGEFRYDKIKDYLTLNQ